jgi:hypothetical protein
METKQQGIMRALAGLAAVMAVSLGLWGCPGANNNGEKLNVNAQTITTPPGQVAAVGLDVCTICHERKVPDWLVGQHGNENSATPALSGTLDSTGMPTYADIAGDPTCLSCHDPLGDGHLLESTLTGNTARPVIGCESCHGGGAEHFGAGAIPFPKPGADQCGQCHNQNFPTSHLTTNANGGRIVEDYRTSPHAGSINSHTLANGGPDVMALCSRCHTDEGYKKYRSGVPGTTGHDTLINDFASVPPLADASDITCRSCHDGHKANATNLTVVPSSTVNGKAQSSEFNTCTSCHQLTNATGDVLQGSTVLWSGTVGDSTVLNGDSFGYHDPRVNPYGSNDEIMYSNHAALPGDHRGNYRIANPQALYFVKKGDPNACAGCHNPHSADLTINEQYARSGHGDPLAAPWVDDPWPQDGKQSACKRCHSSTGYKLYANGLRDGATYDPDSAATKAEFAWLNDGATIHNETLYCWACHAVTSGPNKGQVSYKGELRNPGRYYLNNAVIGSATYQAGNVRAKYLPATPFVIPQSGDTLYPDLAGSNVCMPCHSGRESGGSIKNADKVYPGHAAQTTFANINFKNSHYLAGGGDLFREIGYEFYPNHNGTPGDTVNPNYANVSYFQHDIIGTPAAGATVNAVMGTQGPCIGCHMHTSTEKHLFTPVVSDGSTSTLQASGCAVCHTGPYAMSMAKLEEEEAAMEAGAAALIQVAANRGYYWKECNPYVFAADCSCDGSVGTKCGTGTALKTTNWCNTVAAPCLDQGKNTMGALFNLNMLKHEPGNFAHNSYYTKHLLYDSIDWLDDWTMNQSVATSLPTLVTGTTLTEAQGYLLGPSGKRP